MKPAFFALLLLLSPLYARAQDVPDERSFPQVRVGAKGTVGSGGYKGRGAYIQLGRDWTGRLSYSDYRFDGSTGTTRTLGARLGWQGESMSLGVNGSVVPRNDNYANRSFGLEGAWIADLTGGAEDASGLEEFEFGGWWTQTRHSQIIPGNIFLPAENPIINQHDLGLTAAITGWDFTLSMDASKSHYDRDFSGLPRAAAFKPRLGEALALVNGFPDAAGSARIDYAGWEHAAPYISYASTRYKLQPQPSANTAGAGLTLRAGGANLDLGYELVRSKGVEDTKYFTFGGSWRY